MKCISGDSKIDFDYVSFLYMKCVDIKINTLLFLLFNM